MVKYLYILLIGLLSNSVLFAQGWEVMHPGGGGQIMGIDLDINTPGKAFESSDMEGTNISYDYGQTWHNTGHSQNHTFQFTAKPKPGNSSIVLSGGIFGVHKSTDGGESWTFVNDFYPNPDGNNDRGSVASIAWDPSNPNYVYAAHGWKHRADRLNKVTGSIIQTTTGNRKIGVSADGGTQWNFYTWNDVAGDKNCYAVKVHPTNGDVYLSTEAGIYRSTNHGVNWSKINSPASVSDYTKGVSISPNGEYIYATFRVDASNANNYEIYGARTSDMQWFNVHGSDITVDSRFYDPSIDPRDQGNSHHILLAGLPNPVSGLWEGIITWPVSGAPTFSWERIFRESYNSGNGNTSNGYSYDQGWRPTSAKCSHHLYTPANWSRMIWVTDDEGLFVGNPSTSKYTRWQPLYCENVGTKNGKGLYKTRGFESTWTWDVDAADDFVIQGQADNGIAQSWDNGQSWQQHLPIINFSDCGATLIVKGRNSKTLLVGGSINVYGGGTETDPGVLYGRQLPDGTWKKAGDFPKIFALTENPFDNNQVFMGTAKGVYSVSNISTWMMFNGSVTPTIISSSINDPSIKEVMADPNTNGRIYVLCQSGTYRVDNATNTNATWTKIHNLSSTGQNVKSLSVWKNETTTYIALGDNDKIFLSSDAGQSWNTVIDRNKIIATRPMYLEPSIAPQAQMNCDAVTGINNEIFVALEADIRKGYGVLRGKINGNSVTWSDFTGKNQEALLYSRSRRAKIRTQNGKTFLYLATSGTGVWRRDISEVDEDTAIDSPIQDFHSIQPNPCKDELTIITQQLYKGYINLYGVDGKKLLSWFHEGMESKVNISILNKGVYLIKSKHSTHKIFKY